MIILLKIIKEGWNVIKLVYEPGIIKAEAKLSGRQG